MITMKVNLIPYQHYGIELNKLNFEQLTPEKATMMVRGIVNGTYEFVQRLDKTQQIVSGEDGLNLLIAYLNQHPYVEVPLSKQNLFEEFV